MDFLLLVLVNIVMATIFYLIIRLKLENTSSGYREKKLKREIDEIISEFNEVAERNISILENRIASVKKLLEKSGNLKSIDIQIDDSNHFIKSKIPETDITALKKFTEPVSVTDKDNEREISYTDTVESASYLKIIKENIAVSRKIFINLKSIIINKYKNYKNNLIVFINDFAVSLENKAAHRNDVILQEKTAEKPVIKEMAPCGIVSGIGMDSTGNNTIIKNFSAERVLQLNEGEISEMFIKTDDKYLLISELYHKGYSANIITKCSGIPMGEVKLVLDLNDSL